MPSGMSDAITFQVAREFNSPRFNQPELRRPEKMAFGSIRGLLVRAVGAAIAALVQHEHIEMRTVIQRAIDPSRLRACLSRIGYMSWKARAARATSRLMLRSL